MTTLESTITKSNTKATALAIDGLFIALTCVATAFINVKLPVMANGGLIHLGNVPLFIAAILFGKRTGALAGAFGMGLFDLLTGWALWAPFTFVIVGLMGFTVGAVTEKQNHKTFKWNLLAVVLACIIKIVGYYMAEGFIYGNWIAPAASIPGNIIQVGIAAIIVLPILPTLRKGLSK
jgi:uncharacterized membrane protein